MTKPHVTSEQYVEASRLHREGFQPVSSKYRRAKALPIFPPDSELLALLAKVNPERFTEIKRDIQLEIARVIGDREITLDPGTYEALKSISREALVGHFEDRWDYPERVVEIRYARGEAPNERRRVLSTRTGEVDLALLMVIVLELLSKFEDATDAARADFQEGRDFLSTKGIEIEVLPRGTPFL